MVKFKYLGKKTRNIMYRGVSFPVYEGYVIEAPEGFLVKHLPGVKSWEKVPADTPANHTFVHRKEMFAKCPVGGLPVKATPGPNKKKQEEALPSPATIPDQEYVNPYDLGMEDDEDARTIEITTNPQPGVTVTETVAAPEDVMETPEPEKAEFVDDPEVTADNDEVEEEVEGDKPEVLSKTEIRRMTKGDLIKKADLVACSGPCLNPDKVANMEAISEDMHKGEIVKTFLDYYGHME